MLFEIYQGPAKDFSEQPMEHGGIPFHAGYAYFVGDTGFFYIDYVAEDGTQIRRKLNAGVAEKLANGSETVDVDDIFLLKDNSVLEVQYGGTGHKTLTANAVLAGNGTDEVQLIAPASGALYYNGTQLTFGTLPVAQGGTGAVNATGARANLDVYSKSEVDTNSTTKAYHTTLYASTWSTSKNADGYFTYNLAVSGLTCGKAGNVPPLITPTSNHAEYDVIEDATAQAGSILFRIKERPANDIGIIVIDNK